MCKSLRPFLCFLLSFQLAAMLPLWAQQPALRITVLTGDGANNHIDNREAVAPVVQVLDAQGEPVKGAEVRFSAPLAGPTVTFYGAGSQTSLFTDDEGRAQSPVLLPNTYEGPFTIEAVASHEGQTAMASIHQTNTYAVPPPPKKKFHLGLYSWVGVGVAAALAITAIAKH